MTMNNFYYFESPVCIVDIETLGLNPRAPILSIGAIVLDIPLRGNAFKAYFHARIDLTCYDRDLLLRRQFDTDYDTFAWWLQQSDAARNELFRPDAKGLQPALTDFCNFYREHHCTQIWARGPQFDVVVLEHALRLLSFKPPWDYNSVRDTRTILELLPQKVKDSYKEGMTEHNALDDAGYEGFCMLHLWTLMGRNHD